VEIPTVNVSSKHARKGNFPPKTHIYIIYINTRLTGYHRSKIKNINRIAFARRSCENSSSLGSLFPISENSIKEVSDGVSYSPSLTLLKNQINIKVQLSALKTSFRC
jgi:hypothetical protein